MSAASLKPVAFDRRPEPAPRIRDPYVPGRRSKRFWSEEEIDVVRRHYPTGGATACLAHLPAHRTPSTVYQQALRLGFKSEKLTSERQRHPVSAELDERIRQEWALLDGNKRGAVTDLATRLELPRWVLSKRANVLGLTVSHKKEPPWTAAEDLLMTQVPLSDPTRAAKIFREHGYKRTATAITVRAKRLDLSRRESRPRLSATQAARILGIDIKGITALCIAGTLPATKRDDARTPQQGGAAWDIRPSDLRRYISDQIASIDFRKVDKVALVDLLLAQDPASKLEAAE